MTLRHFEDTSCGHRETGSSSVGPTLIHVFVYQSSDPYIYAQFSFVSITCCLKSQQKSEFLSGRRSKAKA